MDPKQQDEFRKLISKEMDKTSRQIEEYKELTKPIAPDNAIGRVSRMDAINNKSVNEASLVQAEQKFRGLQESLKRIGEPDFGICQKCQRTIPAGRLLLMPHSRFCVNCAQ